MSYQIIFCWTLCCFRVPFGRDHLRQRIVKAVNESPVDQVFEARENPPTVLGQAS